MKSRPLLMLNLGLVSTRNGVVPRPIAFLSTQDSKVVRNLAPFSYFNVASHNPPTIMISINSKANGHKDSASNILETKRCVSSQPRSASKIVLSKINRFTVNLISEPFIEAANYTCIDAPPEVDEWALSGLTPLPSNYWEKDGGGPPRVGESPFSLECELYNHMPITDDNGKQTGTIVLGRVRNYVLNEGKICPSSRCCFCLLIDFFEMLGIRQEDGSIDPRGLLPISRGGGITYFRTLQGFELPRPVWKDEQDNHDIKTVLEEASKKKTT